MGNKNTSRGRNIGISALSLPAISGCARAPSIDVLGAYFPDWIFCIAGGILIVTFLRMIMPKGYGLEEFGLGSLVSYLALVSIFAVLGWLLIFGG